jgi:hypothetical protein
LPDDAANVRLRLVLAEDEVQLPAMNGIRLHEMLARVMPGGPAGIAPIDGKLAYAKTLDLAAIKQELADYLAEYEAAVGTEFPAKPLELDKLHLVAFVQDDETREVLQAAAIPVEGGLAAPETPNPNGGDENP